ncbi:MAG: DUF3134 domain-containing protein [Cyanobacteria bacterium RI_101]|jgi:hypothetical protein|nr:DUF3134 domain-containing protein [Cyanobacteria bacterium RI_101]
MYNPSLRREPRTEPAAVLPITRETSLIDWLESSGRMIARAPEEVKIEIPEEDEEITELMGDDGFDDMDDDLDLSDED